MGHNFGLYHAHALDCGGTTLGTTCTSSDYGDTIDMMGLQSAGHFSAFQKERMGWLNYNLSPPITIVQSSGIYPLDPFESLSTNPKALKILKSTASQTGANTWYYLEQASRPVSCVDWWERLQPVELTGLSVACARPRPIFGLVHKPCGHRVLLYIRDDPSKLPLVAHPVVVGLVLPKSLPGAAQNLVGSARSESFDPPGDLRQCGVRPNQ